MNDASATHAELIRENEALRREIEQLRRGDLTTADLAPVELELRRQQDRLRLIVDGVRDHAISMLDAEGRVETFNATAERIKGYALSEVQGRYFGLFFTPEDRATGLPEIELETARAKGRYEGEGWRLRKDGSRFYAAVALSALHDPSGRLIGFVKVTQDRTRHRELTEEVARRESELRLIIDAVPGLVAYINVDRTYRSVNAAYEQWFGRPRAEVVGRTMVDVLGEAAYALLAPHVDAALGGEPVTFEHEVPYRWGGTRWVRATYVPDRGPGGRIDGYVSTVMDVTETKRAEQRVAEEARVNERLHRVGTALAEEGELEPLFRRLTDEATALCRAQFGAFFYNVLAPDGGKYMLYTISGVPREMFSRFPMPRNTHVFAPTFAGSGVTRSDDITADPRYGQNPPYHGMPAGHLPVRSYLAVPVVSRSGEVHGGLFFGHAQPAVFTERDEKMLVAVAAQVALAVDRSRMVAATHAAEQQYRTLAESSPQLVWTTTPSGETEYANPQFVEFVGMSLEELRAGPRWDVIVHPADAARAAEAWARAVETGQPYQVEYRFRSAADGSYRWFLARGAPVRDTEGQITRWVGTCTDIDERKRIEDTQRFLAEAGKLLASSLDHRETLPLLGRLAVPHMADWSSIELMGDSGRLERIAVAHAEPRRIALVDEIQRRYPPDEKDLAHRVAVDGAPVLVREVSDDMLVAGARDPDHLELMRALGLRSWMAVPILVQRRSIGVIAFASAESGRLFDERDLEVAEEIGRRVGVAIDNARLFELTQRERVRAEEASRAKDELLSMTSHELRTPLNAILGWSRLLRSSFMEPATRERALETIERNAAIQIQLVEDLLDVSRVITGRLRLSLEVVDVVGVIEAAVDVIRPAADAKSVRVQILLDPAAGHVHGDAGRLQQVVWNLLSNAVKFTPKGGRVYLRVERQDSHVAITVSDTGQGIVPEFLPHVFQPFRQQDGSITRRHGGLGLGLAIVKHLVELHGGSITALSEGPGQGATFIVRLPITPLRSSAAPPRPAPSVTAFEPGAELACPPELEGLRVLVVDDEPDAVELVRSVLVRCGAIVRTAGSAKGAFELFQAEPPDVLVSDIGMPEESGYELIRRIRRLPLEAGGRTPAVALTAYASMNDRTRALLEGYTNHCAKPTEPRELIATIAALAGPKGAIPPVRPS